MLPGSRAVQLIVCVCVCRSEREEKTVSVCVFVCVSAVCITKTAARVLAEGQVAAAQLLCLSLVKQVALNPQSVLGGECVRKCV